MENELEKIKSAFLGQAIGDALGVPVEFSSREHLAKNPVKDYMGYMCWNQPPGTFSDDSSMMFCTAESLCLGFDIEDMAKRFVKWYKEGYWGARHELFDIGGTTRYSLDRIVNGESAYYSGDFFPESNGNGSLMRILPLVFYLQNEPDRAKRYEIIKQVSSITHAHFRSVMSCFIFVEYGIQLMTDDKHKALQKAADHVKAFIATKNFNQEEVRLFDRVLNLDITHLPAEQIASEGYVLHSLESSIWCLLTTDSYVESVLKAVNLGGDTDTTAAINGGLAGLYYGLNNIPDNWKAGLARVTDIEKLCADFYHSLNMKNG
ncbi:ADP-ribosylglycohydrolase family protein [Fulvivirga sediminis]|uniref:ADP-ribosylglycohydrolase family protein n=1 Tax=Fulvivirga sediminis TaxID=2803949 RepID=A0A937F552_9BACT|nr:ADP-ribosylglycohydrolase family protein [Fulvivirga sediminis]MBL3654510.1 ADP-ribosylglycohydrolase family protein [Fulvivirga sediminis]